MKKSRIILYASLALAALMASCSGLDKMKKNAMGVKYEVTPSVLETHAGKVDVQIKVNVPAKFFDKKSVLKATPTLVYAGGETPFAPYTLQGEAVQGNDKVMSYTNGGSFTYTGSVPYNENMKVSNLVVKITATRGTKSLDFDPVKIADGVIATSTLVEDKGAYAALGKNNFQRITSDSKAAEIFFMIQQSAIQNKELSKEEIKALNDYIVAASTATDKKLKNVSISAYASPDGGLDLNTKLSTARQTESQKSLENGFKKAKVQGVVFDAKSTPEDWDGFKAAMEASTIQDKELILRVLSMYSDPEIREKEIKNMSSTFKVIATDVLPKLRRSKLAANVDLIGRSDEQILELAASNPSALSNEELLYAATVTTDLNKQYDICKKTTEVYPNDWRGFNNLAVICISLAKLDEGQAALDKANTLSPNQAEVNNNLGVVALNKGDLVKAKEFFGAAAGVGGELDNNLGILAIHSGEYDNAMKYFNSSTSNNAALAKILAGKNDAALVTLNANTQESGLKYYLKAVVGAKTSDNDLMFQSLRKAIELEPALKATASKDMVFAKFFEDATFKSIIQ